MREAGTRIGGHVVVPIRGRRRYLLPEVRLTVEHWAEGLGSGFILFIRVILEADIIVIGVMVLLISVVVLRSISPPGLEFWAHRIAPRRKRRRSRGRGRSCTDRRRAHELDLFGLGSSLC